MGINQIILGFIILSSGALSWNPTLESVGHTRQLEPTKHPISRYTNIHDYDTLVGLPNYLGGYIGREVYFLDDRGGLFGPWLVVDVESDREIVLDYSTGEKGQRVITMAEISFMDGNYLAADVGNPLMVYHQGKIVIKENRR